MILSFHLGRTKEKPRWNEKKTQVERKDNLGGTKEL